MAKRKGYRMYIHGSNFLDTQDLSVRFDFKDQLYQEVKPVFKNPSLLAVSLPDMLMGALPDSESLIECGPNMLGLSVTLNGQQFCANDV